jgi:hypothetical protein
MLYDANVKFEKKKMQNWYLNEKYKRDKILLNRVKKELLKIRMGDFWANVHIKFNNDLDRSKQRAGSQISASGISQPLSRMSVTSYPSEDMSASAYSRVTRMTQSGFNKSYQSISPQISHE